MNSNDHPVTCLYMFFVAGAFAAGFQRLVRTLQLHKMTPREQVEILSIVNAEKTDGRAMRP